MLQRIRSQVEPILRNKQNGFKHKRSATTQILALRRLIGVKPHNLKAIPTFVDIKKVFDAIHLEELMPILRAYGVPAKLSMQSSCFTKIQVLSPDEDTEFSEILAGVLQARSGYGKICHQKYKS